MDNLINSPYDLIASLGAILFTEKLISKSYCFIHNLDKKSKQKSIILLLVTAMTIIFLYFLTHMNRNVRVSIIVVSIFIIVLSFIFLFYISEKIKYYNLTKKYNNLIEYAYTHEDALEEDQLFKHEYKNQLVVIKGLTKNRKVNAYIDGILKDNKKVQNINIRGINNLPRGELRELIYYKLCLIKKKNIKFSLDISNNIKNIILELSNNEKRTLSYVIGVFMDNAIEECERNEFSNLSIEIYQSNKTIKIVISNTINNKININEIGERGYSTKGNNHGNGLFLVRKILNNNETISTSNKIINGYFIQEIKIKAPEAS